METQNKTEKETLISKLNSAIAAADAPEGVSYSVDDMGDKVQLTAIYSEEHEYFDEPFDVLGDVVNGMEGLLTNDDHGTVYHTITYPIAE